MRSLLTLTVVGCLIVFSAVRPAQRRTPTRTGSVIISLLRVFMARAWALPVTACLEPTPRSRPSGPSYGSNLPAYGFLPGRYGVGLWRPGFVAPGYVYGEPTSGYSYRDLPVVYGTGLTAGQIAPPPPMGVYAPAFGPGAGLYGAETRRDDRPSREGVGMPMCIPSSKDLKVSPDRRIRASRLGLERERHARFEDRRTTSSVPDNRYQRAEARLRRGSDRDL